MSNLKTKVDDLDVDKLKTVSIDLNKSSDVMSKEAVKKTMYKKLNTKVNNLENKIPNVSILIQTIRYNIDKQKLEQNIGNVENKIPDVSGLVNTAVVSTKIGVVGNKVPSVSGSVKKAAYDTKTSEIEEKYFTTADYDKLAHGTLDAKTKKKKNYSINLIFSKNYDSIKKLES